MATNFIENIEPALTRPGRIDAAIPVPYPDAWSRESILEGVRGSKPIADDVKQHIVAATAGWPWSTFNQLCQKLPDDNPTTKAADALMSTLAEFERADVYYLQEDRWKRPSRPLMMEFIRHAMSLSKDKKRARSS